MNGQLSGVVKVSGQAVAEHDSVKISILVQLGVEIKDIPWVLVLMSGDIARGEMQALCRCLSDGTL